MLDQSSIMFSSQRSIPSVFTLSCNQYDVILCEFEHAIQSLSSGEHIQPEILTKLNQIMERTRKAFKQLRSQGQDSRKRCLEHIEILLYQRDYQEALTKIDYYKNNPEVDASAEVSVSEFDCDPLQTYREHCPQLTFEEALEIVQNRNKPFEERHQAWLSVMTNEDWKEYESLYHITYDDVENAQIQRFKQQFSIIDEEELEDSLRGHASLQGNSEKYKIHYDQSCKQNYNININTPEKKLNAKSMACLKNSKSHAKQKSNKIEKTKSPAVAKSKASAEKKSHQKRTVRKVGEKDLKQSKTCRKKEQNAVVPFVF